MGMMGMLGMIGMMGMMGMMMGMMGMLGWLCGCVDAVWEFRTNQVSRCPPQHATSTLPRRKRRNN